MSEGEQKAVEQPTEVWAVVEILGRDRIAGRLSEVVQFGVPMLRVDVPAIDGRPGYTKDFGGSSIFSITRTTRELATKAAAQMYIREPAILGLPAPVTYSAPPDHDEWSGDEFDDDDDEEWDDEYSDDEEPI